MAGEALDRLLEMFQEIAGDRPKAEADAPSDTVESAEPAGVYQTSATTVGSNVHPAAASSTPASSGGGTSAASIATTFFESGLGMMTLVKGIMGIFGGGGSDAPPPLEKYQMPSAIEFDSAETSSGLGGADYDQSGNPRAIAPVASSGGAAGGGGRGGPPPQITVNVQTIDAQSFMDHSSAIAEAVRGAMLNSSSINDVVSEL